MNYFLYPNFNNPWDNRLAKEHELVHDFCAQSKLVSYEAPKRKGGYPPDRYLFHYELRSIVGINPDKTPLYGENHTAEIIIPSQYPVGGQPACNMRTPVWHPNIKYTGSFAGKICINPDALGPWHTLDMLAERIGEMLQYRNYHALPTHPFPEDAVVAEWVRDFAEPNKVVNKAQKIYVDNRPLLEATEEWVLSRRKKIAVLGQRRNAELSTDEAQKIIRDAQPKRLQITMKKKSE